MRLVRLLSVLTAMLVWPHAADAWTWPAGGEVLQQFAFDQAHP